MGVFFFFFLSTEGFIGYVRFLSFFFFNYLIFFSFFFFPADLGVRCVCERSMVEISLLVEEVSLE